MTAAAMDMATDMTAEVTAVGSNARTGLSGLADCTLCPRQCHADRLHGQRGRCGADEKLRIARAALHLWEEPCISGQKGSGTVFFTGCGLRCCFCQNHRIAMGNTGREITVSRLADIFLELEQEGAANINLVTGTHFVLQILAALEQAKGQGLSIPVVYNSGGYESVETLRMLEGFVDIYLPDMKYLDRELAQRFSGAPDYPEAAREAIAEMVRQTGSCRFDREGYLEKGTVVRHLVLPGHTRDSIRILRYLHETYGSRIFLSIMNQYTPVCEQERYPELNRRVTKREYEKVLQAALELGIENGFFQEGETARESFIPDFSP